MSTETPIEVGTILYAEVLSRNNPTVIKQFTVTKIGRIYYDVEQYGRPLKVNKTSLKYEDRDYSQHNIQFYRSEIEISEKNEAQTLYNDLQRHFNDYTNRIPLPILRQIHALITYPNQ